MQEQIQNLKQSQLTQVLADGFAELYHKQPQFPVAHLAAFLKQHSHSKKLKQQLITNRLKTNKNLCDQLNQQAKSKQRFQEQQTKRQQADKQQLQNYLKKIESTQYHEDILNDFCTWIEDTYMLTGAYIGQLKNKKKTIDLIEQDSEQAHFDPQAQKLIYFEASSKSHIQLMKNKTLTQDSVLGKLLNSDANQGQQQQGDDGQQKIQSGPKDQIYYPTVVDKNQIKFFRFPRLGAFYGIGIKIKSYMSENLIEPNATKVEAYFKSLQEYERQKQQRQTKFRQSYDQKAGSGAQEEQLQQMQKQFQKQQANFPKPQYPQLEFIEKKIVFGCDTLGQDRQISKQDRIKIRQHLQFLKNQWQKKQIQALKTDIQRHLKLPQKLQTPAVQILAKLIEDEDRQLPSSQQAQKYKDNQKYMELQVDTLRIQKLKQYLTDQKYQPFLQQILQAKILKYKQVLKYWLIFCSHKKQDINIYGTNILDLRKAKKLINENIFVDKVSEYNPRGAKPDIQVINYAKWQRMQQNLQKIDINAVAGYNIYLAFILRALVLIAKVRQADRSKRVQIMLQERTSRRQKIKENKIKQKSRDEKLEAAKAQAAQKQEQFDQQAWINQYMEQQQNQMAQIITFPVDQIDKDLSNGQQIFPEPVEQEQKPAQQEQAENPAQQ